VEFTYTVAKKIKAQVLNPPPPSLPPKLGMFFPPSHVFLGRNHSAITSHQPDNILVSTTRVLNLSQKFINDSDNCNELRNNYSVGTQRVTDEPKWVSTTASGLNSLTQLQVTSTNTHVANYGNENSEQTTSNIFRVVQEGRWYACIHTTVATLETTVYRHPVLVALC
jgi:hypothetical protein